MRRPPAGFGVLAAAVLFSTGGAAIKATGWGDLQVAGLRSGIAAAAVVLLAALLGPARPRLGWRTWLVGVAYAATLTLYVAANKRTTAANAIFLEATAPLYVLLLGPWLLGEATRRRDLLFMAALALGLGLFFVDAGAAQDTAPAPFAGNVLGALGGFCWALTVVGLRWLGRSTGDAAGADLGAVVAGNLLTFAACLPGALPLAAGAAVDWLVLGYLGVFQVAVAYLFLTAGIRRVSALEASLLLLLNPVLSPGWAWLVHGEVPGGWSLAGAGVILLATAGKTWLEAGRRPVV